MTRAWMIAGVAVLVTGFTAATVASGQSAKTSHKYWPKIQTPLKKAKDGNVKYVGTSRNDELLGHHGSDDLRGGDGSDVLWGDWDPVGQPTTQKDVIYGGNGTDFIYGSHGTNEIYAGRGNDVISIHYGKGRLDCGPGRDVYHVARSRKRKYKIVNCEKVYYRPESVRGGPLKPLS